MISCYEVAKHKYNVVIGPYIEAIQRGHSTVALVSRAYMIDVASSLCCISAVKVVLYNCLAAAERQNVAFSTSRCLVCISPDYTVNVPSGI